MQADPIDQYLERLKRRLPAADLRTSQVLGEAERDLRAVAARFAVGGWTREEAAAQAIAQYPSVEALAGRFALDAAFAVAVSRPVKLALSAVVLLAAALVLAGLLFAAGLLLAVGLSGRGLLELSASALVAFAVLGHGGVTLRLLWSGRRGLGVQRSVVFLGGLVLAVTGGFIAVWSLHMGATAGDWDGYAVLRGPLIALQGGLAAWISLPRVWSPWLE